MSKKNKQYRTSEELKAQIVEIIKALGCASRLEIARQLKVSKSPHLIKTLNEMCMDFEIMTVKQWQLSRKRHILLYFVVSKGDRQFIISSPDDRWTAARKLYTEFYMDANDYNVWQADYLPVDDVCPVCNMDAYIKIRLHNRSWCECMDCGHQVGVIWEKGA